MVDELYTVQKPNFSKLIGINSKSSPFGEMLNTLVSDLFSQLFGLVDFWCDLSLFL